MKKNNYMFNIILITFILFTVISCENNKKNTIKIGAILPFTGSANTSADQVKEGIELAKEDFLLSNKNFNIEVIYGDSRNSAKNGLSEYIRLKNVLNIKYFLASLSGVVVPLVQTVKNDSDIVLMTTINSAAGVPQAGNNIFRIFVSVENEAKTMAKFIINDLKLDQISVLYINDDFGLSGRNAFSEHIENLKNNVIWSSSFEKDGRNFLNTIQKIPKKTDVVYVIGYETAFGLIIKQLREFGYKNTIVTTIGLSVAPWRAIAGDAAEGVYYTSSNFSISKPSESNSKFINKFKQKYGENPTSFTAFGYDAAYILFKGIASKINEGLNVIESIKNVDYIGTMGKVTFDTYGEADLPLSVFIYKNGVEEKIK